MGGNPIMLSLYQFRKKTKQTTIVNMYNAENAEHIQSTVLITHGSRYRRKNDATEAIHTTSIMPRDATAVVNPTGISDAMKNDVKKRKSPQSNRDRTTTAFTSGGKPRLMIRGNALSRQTRSPSRRNPAHFDPHSVRMHVIRLFRVQ